MKLLIAVPTLDFVHVDFMRCLVNLTNRLKDDGVCFDVCIVSGTLVYVARDRLACKAINENYTHVLWLDSDMVFQPEVLYDLMDTGKDFVSGIYHARRSGFMSCIFKRCDDLNHLERFDEYPRDTFQIGGCGFGCVLVSVEMLRTIQMHFKTCFLPLRDFGEDIAFCNRAKELGFKLWCEPTVRLGHIGHLTVWPEDEEKWKSNLFMEG